MKKLFIIIVSVVIGLLSIHAQNSDVDLLSDNDAMPIFPFSEIRLNNDLILNKNSTTNGNTETNTVVLLNRTTNKSLVLREDSFKHGRAWEFFEERGEIPFGYYQIAGALIDEKDLYVVYHIFGKISLHKYHFTDTDKFEETNREIESSFITPAYGNIFAHARFKKIDGCIYILLAFGQTYNKTKEFFLKVSDNLKIENIKFEQPPKCIAGVYIENKQHLLNHIEQEERNRQYESTANPRLEAELLSIKDEYFDVPYVLKNFDSEYYARQKQLSSYNNKGLRLFHFFDHDQNVDTLKAQKYIPEVLAFAGRNKNITLLDFMNDSKLIYFFYFDHLNRLKILQYHIDKSMWVIADYSKEKRKKNRK